MITSIVIPVLAVMVLAVVHGLLRPRAGCGSSCEICTHACNSVETEDHHVT
jgi:hypothetical protein